MSTNPTGDAKIFRNGIMNMNVNQFGRVGEVVVETLMGYAPSKDSKYDFNDENDRRVEVKATKVQKEKVEIVAGNLYDTAISFSKQEQLINQQAAFNGQVVFSCRIQRIKPPMFDRLFYLLFFKDQVEVFNIDRNVLTSGSPNLGYSRGILRFNRKTYQYHRSHYFKKSLSYGDLMEIAKANKS